MKRIRIILIASLCTYFVAAQENDDKALKDNYCVLDEVVSNLSTFDSSGQILMYERANPFHNKQKIFTKEIFQELLFYPQIDTAKINHLIATLDFEYLVSQHQEVQNWDFSKIDSKVGKYEGTPEKLDGVQRFEIAKPIYTKDRKMAFVYYYKTCGHIQCGSSMLMIYIKKKKRWKLYEQFGVPIL